MIRSATSKAHVPTLLYDLQRQIDRLKIKQRIKEARKTAGFTQPELGELLDPPVHWRTVQQWESLKNENVPFDQLDRIAKVTTTSTVWLLHGAREGSNDPSAAEELAALIAEFRDETVRFAETVARLEDLLAERASRQEQPERS